MKLLRILGPSMLGSAILSAAAGCAAAQDLTRPPSGYVRQDRQTVVGTPVDAEPTPFSQGGSCVKLCEYDFTPCDPDYFKVADRRCNFNQKGSY